MESGPDWNDQTAGLRLMGKPLQETEQLAAWRGPGVKTGWPSDHPSITYWREYEAYFDSEGRVKGTRDFDKTDHQ